MRRSSAGRVQPRDVAKLCRARDQMRWDRETKELTCNERSGLQNIREPLPPAREPRVPCRAHESRSQWEDIHESAGQFLCQGPGIGMRRADLNAGALTAGYWLPCANAPRPASSAVAALQRMHNTPCRRPAPAARAGSPACLTPRANWWHTCQSTTMWWLPCRWQSARSASCSSPRQSTAGTSKLVGPAARMQHASTARRWPRRPRWVEQRRVLMQRLAVNVWRCAAGPAAVPAPAAELLQGTLRAPCPRHGSHQIACQDRHRFLQATGFSRPRVH